MLNKKLTKEKQKVVELKLKLKKKEEHKEEKPIKVHKTRAHKRITEGIPKEETQ